MLSLSDSRWRKLDHAYGNASDVPRWIENVAQDSNSKDSWDWMWASLCHQMGVYSAAYAAVPHLTRLGLLTSGQARRPFIELVAHIEGCRQLNQNYVAPIPGDLEQDYFAAVAQIPQLIADSAEVEWDAETALIYAGAILIAKDHAHLGMTVTQLETRIKCVQCGEYCDYIPY